MANNGCIMKSNFGTNILIFLFLNINNLLANEYTISSYNELMNLSLSSGDTIIVNGMIALEGNIDRKFDNLDLVFVGANSNSGFSGNNQYYGFVFKNSGIVLFKNIIFENFVNLTDFGGVVGYEGPNDDLYFISSGQERLIFKDNVGESNGTLYSLGGKIYLSANNNGNITFINNSSTFAGGAISLERYADLEIKASSGGEINFTGNIKTYDSSSSGSAFNAGGGAIINQDSTLNIIADSGNINFVNNYAISGQGGAIYNLLGTSFNVETNNKGNINFMNNTAELNGGALFNNGGNFNLTTNSGSINFIANKASQGGGAIFLYNNTTSPSNTIANITANGGNINFLNNSAGTLGGAINNEETGNTINLTASGGNINFSDNIDSSGYNAIYATGDATGTTTINLNASSSNSILFNDSITGSSGNNQYQILNINNNSSTGTININDKVSNMTINIYDGSTNLGEYNGRYGNFDSSNILNLYGGNITLFNNHTDNLILTTLDGNVNLGLEIDMSNLANSDVISKASDFNYVSGGINISKIKLTHEIQNNLTIDMDLATNLYDFITFNNLIIESSIFNYDITYDAITHDLNFILLQNVIGDNANIYNQEILGVPMSTFAGSYLSQLNIYNQILNFDFNNSNQLRFYVKPFFAKENNNLKYELKTKTKTYGEIIGFDSAMFDLNCLYDFKGTLGFYTGYVGSHSKYKNVKADQDGLLLGLKLDTLFEKKIFTKFAINAIFFDNTIKYDGLDNNFDSYLVSFGVKSGYNFDYNIINNYNVILQPAVNMYYSLIHNSNYITQGNAFIKTNNMVNIFTISPEIKAKLPLFNNTFIPYINLAGVFNINNTNNFMVDSFELIDFMLKDYFEFNIGFDKKLLNRDINISSNLGYRIGGRDGLNLNLGINFMF